MSLLAPMTAIAEDPAKRSSGFYFGGHVGYLFGNGTATLADPIGIQSAGGATPYGAFYGGVQAGYEQHFASRLMLGVELDMSFANYSDLAQRAVVPRDSHRHGQRAARVPREPARPCRAMTSDRGRRS